MKTIGVDLEDSDIEKLLKATGTDNKAEALRRALKEWDDQKGIIRRLDDELRVAEHYKRIDYSISFGVLLVSLGFFIATGIFLKYHIFS